MARQQEEATPSASAAEELWAKSHSRPLLFRSFFLSTKPKSRSGSCFQGPQSVASMPCRYSGGVHKSSSKSSAGVGEKSQKAWKVRLTFCSSFLRTKPKSRSGSCFQSKSTDPSFFSFLATFHRRPSLLSKRTLPLDPFLLSTRGCFREPFDTPTVALLP